MPQYFFSLKDPIFFKDYAIKFRDEQINQSVLPKNDKFQFLQLGLLYFRLNLFSGLYLGDYHSKIDLLVYK